MEAGLSEAQPGEAHADGKRVTYIETHSTGVIRIKGGSVQIN